MRGLVYASEAGGGGGGGGGEGIPLHIEWPVRNWLIRLNGVGRRPKQPVRVRRTKCQRANTCDKTWLAATAVSYRSAHESRDRTTDKFRIQLNTVRIACDCEPGITHMNRCGRCAYTPVPNLSWTSASTWPVYMHVTELHACKCTTCMVFKAILYDKHNTDMHPTDDCTWRSKS